MTLTQALDELVTANRILAREGVVDSFGHVSIRHPDRPDRYILSRARAPECIAAVSAKVGGLSADAASRLSKHIAPLIEKLLAGGEATRLRSSAQLLAARRARPEESEPA